MAPVITVRYADISASGFSPQEDTAHPVPRSFWQAAEDLLLSDVVQPPGSIRSTAGEPIWSLRRVVVEGTAYWCFAVQGRGGPFGVAGTCRFGFMAARGLHPADAWVRGRDELTVGDPPMRAPDARAVASSYRVVLTAVLMNRPVVEIPLDPVDAAALIPNVLAALPVSRTRSWSWSTCLLQRPELGNKRVAAGRLPAAMAANATNLARNLEHMFATSTRGAGDTPRFENDAQRFGFEWLVSCAETGGRLGTELQASDLRTPQLLEQIAASHKEVTLSDVPLLLSDVAQRPRLLKMLDLLRRWAKSNTAQALRHVRDEPDSEVRAHLFGFLVESQEETPGRNLLGLPTASGQAEPGWHGTLAELLHWHFSTREAIGDFVLRLTGPGGIYAELVDRRAARQFWRNFADGYSSEQKAILFEASAEYALSQLVEGDPQDVFDEIRLLRDPLAEVMDALRNSEWAVLYLKPEEAAQLVTATLSGMRWMGYDDLDHDTSERLCHLGSLLTESGGSTEWTREFLRGVLAERDEHNYHWIQALARGSLSAHGNGRDAARPLPGNLRDLFLKAGLEPGSEMPLVLLAERPVPRPYPDQAGTTYHHHDSGHPRDSHHLDSGFETTEFSGWDSQPMHRPDQPDPQRGHQSARPRPGPGVDSSRWQDGGRPGLIGALIRYRLPIGAAAATAAVVGGALLLVRVAGPSTPDGGPDPAPVVPPATDVPSAQPSVPANPLPSTTDVPNTQPPVDPVPAITESPTHPVSVGRLPVSTNVEQRYRLIAQRDV